MKSSHAHPPKSLDRPLEHDPSDWSAQENYHLLTALVIPRPIAWISSLSPDGVRNIAPHSFFNAVSADPPHVMVSSTGVKDSVRNIRATGEFVLNIVTMEVLEDMVFTSTDFPPEEDEFDWSGLTAVPSTRVAPPRIGQAKAHLECVSVDEMTLGDATLIFGRVVHMHIDPGVWRNGRVDPALLDPVCRLSGSGYASLGERSRLAIPKWEDVIRSGHRSPRPC